jgi:hypothetical protein
LKLKAIIESSPSHFSIDTLNSRRFQRGFDRVKLHCPTKDAASTDMPPPPPPPPLSSDMLPTPFVTGAI